MTTIRFTIPGDPGAKGRPRFNRKTGRTYTPGKTESYEAKVCTLAMQAMNGARPIEGPVFLTVTAFFALPASQHRKRKPRPMAWRPKGKDIDNIAKTVMDACNGVLWHDDRQVVSLTAYKLTAAQGEPGRVKVACGPACRAGG